MVHLLIIFFAALPHIGASTPFLVEKWAGCEFLPACNRSLCPPLNAPDCEFGSSLDLCNCCHVCYLAPGDLCIDATRSAKDSNLRKDSTTIAAGTSLSKCSPGTVCSVSSDNHLFTCRYRTYRSDFIQPSRAYTDNEQTPNPYFLPHKYKRHADLTQSPSESLTHSEDLAPSPSSTPVTGGGMQICHSCDGVECKYAEPVSEEDCEFGLVPQGTPSCCSQYECAKGPYETCGGLWGEEGICSQGHECFVWFPYGLSYDHFITKPGRCLSVNQVNQASNLSALDSWTFSAFKPFKEFHTAHKPLKCKPLCSLQFCKDGRNKYCSARGSIALNIVEERGPCQHTTCLACHFWVTPSPCPSCPSPVTRRCMGKYFRCIHKFYLKNDVIMNLTDPRVYNTNGRIYCDVPELTVVM
ncbi:PREDICTED: uncharacterized protein LOC100638201 [Amphimedon queenslandica]|uniref:IGFBP N-terminal domain-containing protein n=1 Tax=Amphimedon queenslandica TaxID=400682 RepID=A0AAN0IAB4_AMPQE|nr:PREDICTED: uncharacterized protein LOC100638201 [Amphimedon queenslandica]|eukprot:XP_003383851.1 PREDICTED: uncharacterized protein LOC100638201 [Amphimedon queenslandica]